MRKISNVFLLFIVNNILKGTRYFNIKRKILILCGLDIGEGTKIVGPIYFGNAIKIKIGENCWLGKNLSLDGNGQVNIGNNVDVAPHVVLNTGGHLVGHASRRAGKDIVNKITIHDGCWLGTRVTIINNTIVNKGVVIGAGSLVINDINKNVLIAGVPAIIKKNLD